MQSAGRKEVEIKLRVENAAALKQKLARLRAKRVGRVHEENVLFDTKDGSLRRGGSLLRLRRNDGEAILTLKSPVPGQRGSRFKVRREVEFAVDAGAMEAMLRGAGFETGFRYEKYRTSYRVPGAGAVVVELDETPIGCFVELEGAPRAIDRLARRLDFLPRDYITANYRQLYAEHCRREGLAERHMTFDELSAGHRVAAKSASRSRRRARRS